MLGTYVETQIEWDEQGRGKCGKGDCNVQYPTETRAMVDDPPLIVSQNGMARKPPHDFVAESED